MESFNGICCAFPGREAYVQGLSDSFYTNFKSFRELFDTVSEFLGEDIYEFSYKSTPRNEELKTICLITHCYGIFKIMEQHGIVPNAFAGFSHGEFTAAVASKAISLNGVLQLVYELETVLVQSASVKNGKMIRIYDLETEQVERCIEAIDPQCKNVSIAAYFDSSQHIVSGTTELVDKVGAEAKQRGARWIINLSNEGAFHSPLCNSILEYSDSIYDKFDFKNSERPLYSCVDGLPSTQGNVIKQRLTRQILRPIMWNQLVNNLSINKLNKFIEVGPGSTLSGNTRIIDPNIECIWVNNTSDFEALLNEQLA